MQLNSRDDLEYALRNTQARLRAYMHQAEQAGDSKTRHFLRACAEAEGRHGEHLRGYLGKLK